MSAYHPDVQISDVLGGDVKRLRGSTTGIFLTVDTDEHDRELLRDLANAVRSNAEVVNHLIEYAEIRDRLDEQERDRNPRAAHRLALEDEAADALGEIERNLDTPLGEGQTAFLNPGDADRLRDALTDWTDGRKARRSTTPKAVA